MKTIENKLFKNKPPTQVEVSTNSANEVLIFTEAQRRQLQRVYDRMKRKEEEEA